MSYISLYNLDKKIASGGEGEIWTIKNSSDLAKIYFDDKRTRERESKLKYLIQNPINNPALVWPKMVLNKRGFVGFTMPRITGESLEAFCYTKWPKKLENTPFDKFKAIDHKRVKICFNIAVALNELHKLNYLITDMKPENIIITEKGLIHILDIDSIHINQSHKATVTTPEYTPHEWDSTKTPTVYHDCFSMTVIFYQLLLGIHPFVGCCKPPFEKVTQIEDLIKNGLFPHGIKKPLFNIIPKPHEDFYKLPQLLQKLFIETFDNGYKKYQSRPLADKWCEELYKILQAPITPIVRTLPVAKPSPNKAPTVNNVPSFSDIKQKFGKYNNRLYLQSLPTFTFSYKFYEPDWYSPFLDIFWKGKKCHLKKQAEALQNSILDQLQELSLKKQEATKIYDTFNKDQTNILDFERETLNKYCAKYHEYLMYNTYYGLTHFQSDLNDLYKDISFKLSVSLSSFNNDNRILGRMGYKTHLERLSRLADRINININQLNNILTQLEAL